MFTPLWRNPLARWLGACGRGTSPGRRTRPRARRLGARRFIPAVQVLEDRRLLAQVLLGGDVLKETFDDLPNNLSFFGTATLDDPGYLGTVKVAPAVFHHDFANAEAFIMAGGDTTPTLAGQSAQDLQRVGGTDTITINPYLPPGASTAEVDEVSLDVTSGQVTVVGRNGQEVLQAVPSGHGFTTLAASSSDMIGQDAAGKPLQLGPISKLLLEQFDELDNVRAVVFFPNIFTPPVARDDVYELPQGAAAGQTFSSRDIALKPSLLGSVLDNDSATVANRQLTGRPATLPSHGHLVWALGDDGAFTYTPDSTFQGTDSFTYTAFDGAAESSPATVTIVTAGSPLDSDGDGVPDAVEALAPANKDGVFGDGNSDGTPDYLEPAVASLPAADNQYWTLVASGGAFHNVANVSAYAAPPLPGGVSLTSGLFKFQIAGLPANELAVVTLTPASGVVPTGANGFYVLNPGFGTWSAFNLDANTGIGATVSGTEVTLHLTASASGVVDLQGGPVNIQPTAYPGEETFVHHPGDFSIPTPLSAQVSFLAPPGDRATVAKVPGSEVGGTVDLNPDGSFVWHGSAPDGSFRFRVTDPGGAAPSAPATETIHIQDKPPLIFGTNALGQNGDIGVTAYDFFTHHPNTSFTYSDFTQIGDLQGNIFENMFVTAIQRGLFQFVNVLDQQLNYTPALDLPPQALLGFKLIVVRQPIRATEFHVNPDGTFRYLPFASFIGTDEFEFKVNDGYEDSNIGFVDIHDAEITDRPQGGPSGAAPLTPFSLAEVQAPIPVRGAGTIDEGVRLVATTRHADITDFQPVANPSPAEDYPPGTSAADFPIGFFHLAVDLNSEGGASLLELELPPDAPAPTKYYKFGPTPDNPSPHWYDFAFENDPGSPNFQTGAVFPGTTDPVTGTLVPPGVIFLHFIPGQRGDNNFGSHTSGDEIVEDPGGPAFFAPAASVSGPASGVAGQPATFVLSAADLSPTTLAAGFTYAIDWGDGSPRQVVAATPGNGDGEAEPHVFGHAGSFTVTVTATDANGLISTAATTAIVVAAPASPGSPAARPLITRLSPPFAVEGLSPLTLTVFGQNFTAGSYVTFDGRRLKTVFVSGNRLVVRDFLGQVRARFRLVRLRGHRRVVVESAAAREGVGFIAVVVPGRGVSPPVPFEVRDLVAPGDSGTPADRSWAEFYEQATGLEADASAPFQDFLRNLRERHI